VQSVGASGTYYQRTHRPPPPGIVTGGRHDSEEGWSAPCGRRWTRPRSRVGRRRLGRRRHGERPNAANDATNLRVTSLSHKSVTLAWDPSTDNSGSFSYSVNTFTVKAVDSGGEHLGGEQRVYGVSLALLRSGAVLHQLRNLALQPADERGRLRIMGARPQALGGAQDGCAGEPKSTMRTDDFPQAAPAAERPLFAAGRVRPRAGARGSSVGARPHLTSAGPEKTP